MKANWFQQKTKKTKILSKNSALQHNKVIVKGEPQ